jgi:hypothetical protein
MGLLLIEESGTFRASLGMNKEGPELALKDEKGKNLASLQAKVRPSLGMFDENNNLRANLYVGKEGTGLDLYDEKGKVRVGLTSFKNFPMLGMNDDKGINRALLQLVNGKPMLNLSDVKANPRAILAESSLILEDENGKIIKSLP